MKIQIKQNGHLGMTLLFPTSLIGLVVCSRYARKYIRKILLGKQLDCLVKNSENKIYESNDFLTDEVVKQSQKKLKQVMKVHKHLTLVDIKAANGDSVKVIL